MTGNKLCGANYFCMGAVLIFIGSVLLCGLGFTVVLPYSATRDWVRTVCNVVNTTFNPLVCSCKDELLSPQQDSCLGLYPCLVVHVVYGQPLEASLGTPSNGSHIGGSADEADSTTLEELPMTDQRAVAKAAGVRDADAGKLIRQENPGISSSNNIQPSSQERTADTRVACKQVVHKGDSPRKSDGRTARDGQYEGIITGSMYRSWADAFYKQCALQECGDEQWNIRQVYRFKAAYGAFGDKFTCYFDPSDPMTAILSRVDDTLVIHAIFWPCLTLFVGAGMWIGLYLGCLSMKLDSPPPTCGHV